jgi:hypothetical protein
MRNKDTFKNATNEEIRCAQFSNSISTVADSPTNKVEIIMQKEITPELAKWLDERYKGGAVCTGKLAVINTGELAEDKEVARKMAILIEQRKSGTAPVQHDSIREKRADIFAEWKDKLLTSPNVTGYTPVPAQGCFNLITIKGPLTYYTKADKVYYKAENRWISPGLKWLVDNIIKS